MLYIPSVSMQLTGDASIHTWYMTAVNYTETNSSVMGRLARKSKHKEKGALTGLTQCD